MDQPLDAGHAGTGMRNSASPPPAVRLEGLSKQFGPVLACDDVHLTVERGVIHGLLGQNGAGKTTLMRMLTGLIEPDSGRILVDGVEQTISDPLVAAGLGIAMVHQHFSLIGALTVWENVTLGERGRVDQKAAIRRVEHIAERYGLTIDPCALVDDLTTGERQRVEIVKCLRRDPSVVVLDEPTSVLTLNESKVLFSVLRHVVQEEGKAVVLISHKLDEILEATDEVTIMRDGRVVRRLPTAEADARLLAREMLGREVSLRNDAASIGLLEVVVDEAVSEAPAEAQAAALTGVTAVDVVPASPNGHQELADAHPDARTPTAAVPVLRIRDANVKGVDGRQLLDGLSLDVYAGEILGLAGVEGNGQTAVGDLLSSLIDLDEGTVEVNGEPVRCGRPGTMLRAGVGVIPEDRHGAGCVLGMSVAENLVMNDLERIAPRRFLMPRRVHAYASRLIREFEIVCPGPDAPMRSLSGGNQQKVVVARELSRAPKVLVAAQPTRGLDVGAIDYMSTRLRDAAAQGVGVLLISAELEELLALSGRVAVIHRGRIVGEMTRADLDLERLGLLMGGYAS